MRALSAVLAASLVSAAIPAAQAPSSRPQVPTFRSEVRLIEIDAVVRDREGHFVPGLTASDFEVLEDGIPRTTAFVSTVALPVDRSGRPLAEREPSPDDDGTRDGPGRIYVMMLASGNPERIRPLATRFIREFLGPSDLMAVMQVARPELTQGLTHDTEQLLAAVNRYSGGGGSVASFKAIKEVAINLNAVSGRRKAILFFGDGPGDMWRGAGLLDRWREYEDAVRTAARNNVRIYPIDPRGLESAVQGVDIAAESNPFGAPGQVWFKNLGGDARSALRMMAEDTGGIAIVNTNNYGGNFGRVVRDNSEYYVLGFYSSAPRDGRSHAIAVRVTGRDDLSIRTRRSYRADTPDVKGPAAKIPKELSDGARAALISDVVMHGLPVDLLTAVFQVEQFDGSVLIGAQVAGAGLDLTPGAQLELSYAAVDRWGTIRATERRAFTFNLREPTRARVRQTGVRLFGRLRLPRGRYELRVAAHQPGGATGSASTEIEIPEFAALPLSVSDIVVTSSGQRPPILLEEDAALRGVLPAPPTASRRFRREGTLTVFAEVYDSHWMLSREIGVTITLTARSGRVVHRAEKTLASGNHGRFHVTGSVPLDAVPAGEYLLGLEAHSRSGIPASASQQLRFEVVDE